MRGRYGGDTHVSHEIDVALCGITLKNVALSLSLVGHPCPMERASFHGLRRVRISLNLTGKKHFANNGKQAACCDAISFVLVVTINCLYIIFLC